MKGKGEAFWLPHVEAIKRGSDTTSAYAKRHGLSVKRLYHWQSKARAAATAATKPSRSRPQPTKKFVALHIAPPPHIESAPACTLVLAGGMRLEMASLPSPTWLAALGRTQGES